MSKRTAIWIGQRSDQDEAPSRTSLSSARDHIHPVSIQASSWGRSVSISARRARATPGGHALLAYRPRCGKNRMFTGQHLSPQTSETRSGLRLCWAFSTYSFTLPPRCLPPSRKVMRIRLVVDTRVFCRVFENGVFCLKI